MNNFVIPNAIFHISNVLQTNGFQAWLVGGAIRDLIMENVPNDYDIATDCTPDHILKLFPGNSVQIGGHCGTVSIKIDDESYEVTPFRTEGTYTDGRRPDYVRFVSNIDEDLQRRDLTINAIAYDLLNNKWCDPYNGRNDIEHKVIRTVGKAEDRFNEDGLRLLRAIRFVSKFNFYLADSTYDAIRACSDKIDSISSERIHDEFYKVMGTNNSALAFRIMQNTGLLARIVPEFEPSVGCEQNKYHSYDVWNHTLNVLKTINTEEPALRFAALFHDIGKPATKGVNEKTGETTFYNHEEVGADMTKSILERLKFSNEERDRIVHHVRWHLIPYEPGWTASAIRRWVRKVGSSNVKSICTLGRADDLGKGKDKEKRGPIIDELENRIANMQINQPVIEKTSSLAINGNDVMKHLNIQPSKRVGDLLNQLLEIVTDDPEKNTREALLKCLETL